MKIELDVHTHTVASGHAFSSLQEMAQAAAGKGLKLLGITEHSPGIPGTCDPIYFRNLHVVPRQMYGIELLLGAEINILDSEGNLVLPVFIHFVISGGHPKRIHMVWFRLCLIHIFISLVIRVMGLQS